MPAGHAKSSACLISSDIHPPDAANFRRAASRSPTGFPASHQLIASVKPAGLKMLERTFIRTV
jgi:hypothetical protein